MKIKRLIALILGGVGVVVLLWWVVNLWERPQSIDPHSIVLAVQKFCRERRNLDIPLPSTVTLRELVQQGYLNPKAIRGFGEMEVTISLRAGDATNSNAVLIEATLPDGTRLNAASDGNVH